MLTAVNRYFNPAIDCEIWLNRKPFANEMFMLIGVKMVATEGNLAHSREVMAIMAGYGPGGRVSVPGCGRSFPFHHRTEFRT